MTPFDEALRSAIRTAVVEQLGSRLLTPSQVAEIRSSLTEVLHRAIPAAGDPVQDIAMRAAIAANLDAVLAELGYGDEG
jgi:hypothetical protein